VRQSSLLDGIGMARGDLNHVGRVRLEGGAHLIFRSKRVQLAAARDEAERGEARGVVRCAHLIVKSFWWRRGGASKDFW
jgi:hypothetical protein